MRTNGVLLRLKAVTRRFGGLTALDSVDLNVPRGQIYGVIGPNGAGKSTLFSVIAGGLAPTSGQVLFEDVEIGGMPSHKVTWRGISRAFQLVNLFDSLTVRENVLIGAERHRHLGLVEALTHHFGFEERSRRAAERADRAIALIGIDIIAHKPVSTLTYGQQRLVAAARAIAANPKLLLLDEPAAGLSEQEAALLATAIERTRASGVTVLIIEHNVNFVMDLCDHVAVLHFGRKIADGDPAAVRAEPSVIEAYLGH